MTSVVVWEFDNSLVLVYYAHLLYLVLSIKIVFWSF